MKYYLDMVVIATSDQTKAALGRWVGFSDYRGEDNAFMSLPRCGAIKGCRPALSECKETSATDAKGPPTFNHPFAEQVYRSEPNIDIAIISIPWKFVSGYLNDRTIIYLLDDDRPHQGFRLEIEDFHVAILAPSVDGVISCDEG